MVARGAPGSIARWTWAVASAAWLAACYTGNPPLGAPCMMDSQCPRGQTCNPRTDTCGLPTGDRAWRDDTAADFAATGAYLDEVTVEAAGFVGPTAYLVGGVRLSGIDAAAIGDVTTATWDGIAAQPRTGTSLARGLVLDFENQRPPALGLSRSDDITVMFETELELDSAGMWRFDFSVDDVGFVEIAPPGSSQFVRLVAGSNAGDAEATYAAPAAGWYRIRGAFTDRSGAMDLALRYRPPNVSAFRRIPADRLRVPVGDLTGMLVDGFEEAHLLGPRGSVRYTGSIEREDFGQDPLGLLVGSGTYSLRWAGQLLIDVEGDYKLRIDSEDGHRAWLDGRRVADRFNSSPRETTTDAMRLEPGWHDLVVDVHKQGGNAAHLSVTVADGPMGGYAIPPEKLRPVVGRGARWAGAMTGFASAIPDNGSVTRTLPLDLPPDLVPEEIDLAFELDHPALNTLGMVLQPPIGPPLTLAAPGSLSGAGTYYDHSDVSPTLAGTSWSFTASDTAADSMTGELVAVAVTVIGPGGIAPFPRMYRYVSAVRDLGDEPIDGFTEVSWKLRQATPAATAIVSIRTCDDAAACEAEPWTAVGEGGVPAVPPRRFAQYMVELTGNGDVPTALDWIEIGYQVVAAKP